MSFRHALSSRHAGIELALIGVAAHCVADVHCR
ncbi:Ms4533A family Cys-rich leader peptide [Actinacidiphila rubida]|nr:Ms4533A family Cys-rich leader peptide [Actinacidiphila rubida]